jgi:Fe2+ or Zn2+ uptake regulation protein
VKIDIDTVLREHGIQPSAQRVAVAQYVLNTTAHPTAEKVAAEVRKTFPMISRATVYNTLNLMVEHGLLREFVLDDGTTVFDANVGSHHHFVDDETGRIHDIPWDSLKVSKLEALEGFEVREYQVVLRGRLRGTSRRRS